MMPDWTYSFPSISKAQWLNQIESDLLPRGINTIESEWWPGEAFFPAHHHEDREHIIALPDSLFTQPPSIMEWIDTERDDAKTINKKVLNALHYGTQAITLHIDANKIMPFRLWLDTVFTDMIELSVSLNDESPEVIHGVREVIPRSALIRLQRNNSQLSSVFLVALQGSVEENAKSFRFVYDISATGAWTTKSAEIFQLILDDLRYWNSQGYNQIDFLENCILTFTPDTHFIKQLIQTRVLHLLWNNLWKWFTKSDRMASSEYLECHVRPDGFPDPDLYLIHASSCSLAASLTGVHVLCIHNGDELTRPSFYDRIDRNIHHLLNMESEMYKGTDPLSGAYTIDFYTKKWTEDIWNLLVF